MSLMRLVSFVLLGTLAIPAFAHAGFDSNTFGGLEARSIGPAVMGGRIAALDCVADDPVTVWVGAASGGVWKSVDAGTTFKPVFDDHPQSVGAIRIDPTDPDVVWAGGVDLFRSDNGGNLWGLVSYWWDSPPSAHADQHAIAFHPGYNGAGNQTLFLAGDGGVWRTNNARAVKAAGPLAACESSNTGVRWTPLNNNLGITQFYHGAPFPGGISDDVALLGERCGHATHHHRHHRSQADRDAAFLDQF